MTPRANLQFSILISRRLILPLAFVPWAVAFILATAVPLSAAEGKNEASQRRDKVVVDEKTDAIIRGALKWLVSKQLPNGAKAWK